MNQLITKILELQELSKELEPTEERRNELNSALCSYSNDFINTLKSHPAFVNDQNEKDKINLDKGKQSFIDFLNEFDQEVHQKGIKPASGGHVGYIPGGGIFTAALGDYLACISNEYAGMHYASPGAVTIENELLDWMKSLFGFPKNAVGNLTSGGSIANMIALTAARDKYGVKNENITKSVIYLSEQVHHCVLKALRIIGLEDVCIRYLKLDAYHKIDTAYLEKVILKDKNKGLCPFLVIASAGTTDTGAIDPLDEIAQLSEKHNLWYHIDGAYGGFFMLCESKKPLFKGIEKADSLVIDPHKGLFLPYGIGAVLIKDREIVYKSHHYTANYMQDAIHEKRDNPADVSPELTKHFRGLRMWIPFKIHGIEPFTACLNEK
jgi:glutamate/tyrosine decarboxylase-like PLP-dependent enzyme